MRPRLPTLFLQWTCFECHATSLAGLSGARARWFEAASWQQLVGSACDSPCSSLRKSVHLLLKCLKFHSLGCQAFLTGAACAARVLAAALGAQAGPAPDEEDYDEEEPDAPAPAPAAAAASALGVSLTNCSV